MKSVTVVPLNGKNYATWKIQCRMALMKDGIWSMVIESESQPVTAGAEQTKFLKKKDKALAIIVLSVDHPYSIYWVILIVQ